MAKTIAAPVVFHGCYDLLLFIQAGECKKWMWCLNLIATTLMVCVAQYMLPIVKKIQETYRGDPPDADVHALIASGAIARPCHKCPTCCMCCY